MLIDNFTPDQMREAVALRDEMDPEVTIEASGGLTIETARIVGATGVDYIAVGELTHSARGPRHRPRPLCEPETLGA